LTRHRGELRDSLCPNSPVRRNPADQAPDGRQGPGTRSKRPCATSERPGSGPSPSNSTTPRAVKEQAKLSGGRAEPAVVDPQVASGADHLVGWSGSRTCRGPCGAHGRSLGRPARAAGYWARRREASRPQSVGFDCALHRVKARAPVTAASARHACPAEHAHGGARLTAVDSLVFGAAPTHTT
jgi:hypothetical protein